MLRLDLKTGNPVYNIPLPYQDHGFVGVGQMVQVDTRTGDVFVCGRDPTKGNQHHLFRLTLDYMPKLHQYIVQEGISFENHYAADPLCCPSRASILRGQYPHNTGIIDLNEPGGGAVKFRRLNLEKSTVGTWLNDAGYHTGFMGKYMNQYPCHKEGFSMDNPPGWDEWFALCDPWVYNVCI